MQLNNYGELQKYIDDPNITDINFNGTDLWVDDIKNGRSEVELVDAEFVLNLPYMISNECNQPFNITNPLLESETKDLRISIIHDSVAKNGHSISIRKTSNKVRINENTIVQDKYISKKALNYLIDSIINHKNIMIAGLPGVGKSELVKFLIKYIQDHERIITIEDTLELKASSIYPFKDIVSLKVNNTFTYVNAIKACLRQKPNWILLSEIRGNEAVDLLASVSTGTNIISTLHASSAYDIPKRILHMFDDFKVDSDVLLTRIYECIDIGILIESKYTDEGIIRYISSIIEFNHIDNKNTIKSIYERKSK